MAENPKGLLNANFIADVEDEQAKDLNLSSSEMGNLVGLVARRFSDSKMARDVVEKTWLNSYRNFRGKYAKNIKFNDHEKSRVFVKITKTKVLAAYGMVNDVIFGSSGFPIGVRETEIPEGAAERAHLNTGVPGIETPPEEDSAEELENPFDPGYAGDGKALMPGATFRSPTKFLQDSTEKFTDAEGEVVMAEGIGPDPLAPIINPAQESAKRMNKLILDQLEESNATVHLSDAIYDSALLGTGIIKGPFKDVKTLHNWTEDEEGERTYSPVDVVVPRIEFVSVWDFYPDSNCTGVADMSFCTQRHRMDRSALRALAKRPLFKKDAIRKCLDDGPNYVAEDFETQINSEDKNNGGSLYADRYEVLEYWGIMDADFLQEVGVKLPKNTDPLDELQVNAWVCGNELLRVAINPFKPHRIPYNAFPYEKNPYSFWGIGVAENMEDSQNIMNGHARMAIDNLALSGSIVFDIDETALVDGQSMKIFPGKVFRRNAGSPGQAVFALKFPNTTTENMQMFDKFRQLSDESTGIPSFSHGQTGIQSTTRTASGMSMLLGAASLNIKTVVKNIDDYLLKPLGDAYFQWNQQFFVGKLGIKGDLEVRALGTSSLMQKEVISQRLTAVLQMIGGNPILAQTANVPNLFKKIIETMDVDPTGLINTPQEQAIAARLLGEANGQGAGQQAPAIGQEQGGLPSPDGVPIPGGEPAGVSAEGGGIAPQNVATPGTAGFSGPVA